MRMYVVTTPLSDADPAGPEGWIKDADAVRAPVEGRGAVIARTRERGAAGGGPDPVSHEIFIGITAGLEEHHWTFQAENG
jgi:starvation-inducible DNA-binding protein